MSDERKDDGGAMSGWQPIETAPRDGTEVLTFRKGGLMAVAIWTAEWGWLVVDGAAIVNVTHWMPLPAPPQAGER